MTGSLELQGSASANQEPFHHPAFDCGGPEVALGHTGEAQTAASGVGGASETFLPPCHTRYSLFPANALCCRGLKAKVIQPCLLHSPGLSRNIHLQISLSEEAGDVSGTTTNLSYILEILLASLPHKTSGAIHTLNDNSTILTRPWVREADRRGVRGSIY